MIVGSEEITVPVVRGKSDMKIKVAIIGLGIMGRRMLEHIGRHESFVPVSMWDPDPEACKLAQGICSSAEIATNAAAAMATADLVYLACPPVPRHKLALAAAAAGKAVFLEKPLGVDLAASKNLVESLKDTGVPAAVNFTQAAGAALANISQAVRTGTLGEIVGIDIILTYGAWPRAWQKEADWLRFRAEGGMTREVLSHFLFFSERLLGPLKVVFAHPSYPADRRLCETHLLARLETPQQKAVSILATVGGVQPDCQQVTIKGSKKSRRVAEFSLDMESSGGPFVPLEEAPADRRAVALKAQLDDLRLCFGGKPHRLATPAEALRVQTLVENMLAS